MLCMTRTPLRVSLFGGGTDYQAYYDRTPGAVVGMAIDKYIYISSLMLRTWQTYNYRVAYSVLEQVQSIEEIKHPVVREVLKHYGVTTRLDLGVQSDLPSSGGLGSSSAFTVGFVNLIATLFDRSMTKVELARKAMFVEQVLLEENVGVQDQLHTAVGGLNRFDFDRGRFRITPLQVEGRTLDALNRSMFLIHTGLSRRASDQAARQIATIRTGGSDRELAELFDMVGVCTDLLENAGSGVARELGALLHQGWGIKRAMSPGISNPLIDDIYKRALTAGAYGGKLCGAGGGGFILVMIEPDRAEALARLVAPLPVIPIRMDVHGSTLVQPAGGVWDREDRAASLRSRVLEIAPAPAAPSLAPWAVNAAE